jgi:hypothetical protein
MRELRLSTIGAFCALLGVGAFVVGVPFMISSGVQVLIPETGEAGREWIVDVDAAGSLFIVGAWLTVAGGIFLLVALVGFYDALREAGPALVLAPILGAVGMTLVTVSHLLPIAMAYELVPGYVEGSVATKETLAVTADTFATTSLVTNYAGNALGWGVVVPMYAYAILKTAVLPRWIGWVGIVTAVFAGWLGLLGPALPLLEGLSAIGFVGFFVFMASAGIALLRRKPADLPAPVIASP